MTTATKKDYKLSDLFGKGNAKLGPNVLTWSIPAVHSCPGSTALCRSLCYADKNFFRMAAAKSKFSKNWQFSKRKDFVAVATKLLSKTKANTLLRLHVAGDFYDKEYIEKWYDILQQCPHLKTWVYTRSWRLTDMYPAIAKLAALPNVSMWFSCDRETGHPKKMPMGVRTAYMMVDATDIPHYTPDLYFRDYAVRDTVAKYIQGALVCPAENGISGHVQCEKCKVCILDRPVPSRIPLTTI